MVAVIGINDLALSEASSLPIIATAVTTGTDTWRADLCPTLPALYLSMHVYGGECDDAAVHPSHAGGEAATPSFWLC